MHPNPDRSKELLFLPPKKRESRQVSLEQPASENDFKPPAPFQSRRYRRSTEGQRVSDYFHPPPLCPLPPLSASLPLQVSYGPSLYHSYRPIQVGERQGSLSASWREAMCGRRLEAQLDNYHFVSHHSHWLCGDIPPLNVQPLISVPTFKSIYTSESVDMCPYSHTRRDYSRSFSTILYSQSTVYTHDNLPDIRLRNHNVGPNGADSLDGGLASSITEPFCSNHGNNIMTSLDGFCGNGRKKQVDTARQSFGKSLLAQETTSAYFLPRNKDPQGTPNYFSDAEAGKNIASQDYYSRSASQTGAQIYYALGSLCPSAHTNPQPYPQRIPFFPTRNSLQSPPSQHNILRGDMARDPSVQPFHPAIALLTGLDPLAVLPHFAKGSLIELAGGHLKKVEELKTEDFLHSADNLPEFHLSTCTVLLISPGPTDSIKHLQVLLTDRNTQELLTVLAEYPFFVRDRGWSSCSPQRSAQLYGLQCRQLCTGDMCLALTPKLSPQIAHSGSQMRHLGTSKLTCTNTVEGMPPPTAPPPFSVALNCHPVLPRERPSTRKRRWSAPETQSGSPCFSHASKQERRQ